MLITFRSDAGASVQMFEQIAVAMMLRMGHTETVPGAILGKDMGQYLSTLQASLKLDPGVPDAPDDDDFIDQPVSLQQRAFPLLELMKKAAAKDENLMWDYD